MIFCVFGKSWQLFEGGYPFSWFLADYHIGFNLVFWGFFGFFGISKSCTFDKIFTILIFVFFRVFGVLGNPENLC